MNLFSSLLFLFVLFNSISKTYAVDCTPPKIDASCDLNTTASYLSVHSNPESLELNINANVTGSSRQSTLIDITSTEGTNSINVASGVTIQTLNYSNNSAHSIFKFRGSADFSLTNYGTLYGAYYSSIQSYGKDSAAIVLQNGASVSLIDNYGSITHETGQR